MLVGAPHLVHPLLAGATTLAVHSFVKDAFGKRQAMLAAVLFAVSPFTWCIHGTVMAFGPAAAATAAMLAGLVRSTKTSRRLPAALGGLALGALFVTRPFDAVLLGTAAGGWLVYSAWRRRVPWALVAAFVAGFAALGWIVPWYDHALTGTIWKSGYDLEANPIHLGFQQPFIGQLYRHTPFQAAAVEATLLLRTDTWLWGLPGGLVLVAIGAVRREAEPVDGLLRASLACFLLGFVVIPAPGTWDVGPTYGFVLVPILVALATRGVHRLWTLSQDELRARFQWGLVAFVVLGAMTTTPLRLARVADLAAAIRSPWDYIASTNANGAVIVVPSIRARAAAGWGYGYPYEIKTADGKTSKLIEPFRRAEYDEAMAHLGAHDALELHLDRERFMVTHDRQFSLVPFDPDQAWPAAPASP
jgi:4-amino-4-deoxy-L-arabinose transferase-like glycosyltransferase